MLIKNMPEPQRRDRVNRFKGELVTVVMEVSGIRRTYTGRLLGTAQPWMNGNSTGEAVLQNGLGDLFIVAIARIRTIDPVVEST